MYALLFSLLIALFSCPLQANESPPTKTRLRIFFPQMHSSLVQSMGIALQTLGHTLVVPGESFSPHSPAPGPKLYYGTFFKKNPLDSESYVHFFSKDLKTPHCAFLKNVEVIENDEILISPPDVLCVNCWEVERAMNTLWQHLRNLGVETKLMHYSGNNGSGLAYQYHLVKNLIAVDTPSASAFSSVEGKNTVFWIPWIPFDLLPFKDTSDLPIINSYIGHYYSDNDMPKSRDCFYEMISHYKAEFPEITFNLFPLPGAPFMPHDEILVAMQNSAATLHIKETEGFGYTIIESIAQGRPVFLKRSFSSGSRMMDWCIEGKTAFFFDDYEEFRAKMHKFLNDKEFRHKVQKECATAIRQLIDNEKQLQELDHFLQNLQ